MLRIACGVLFAMTCYGQQGGAVTTNSSALVVDTPPTNAAASAAPVPATFQDIKEPVPIPEYLFWTLVVVGCVVLIVGGYFAWTRWLKAKFGPKPLPPLPPHVRAKRKLREALAFINESERFTVFVSSTIRIYLEERFSFHAPERTTEEFLHELQSTPLLMDAHKKSLGDFLTRCDMIKFAKYDPTPPELESLHQSAMSLIEDTEPKPTGAPAQVPSAK